MKAEDRPYNLDFFNLIGTTEVVPFPNPMHEENSLRRTCRVKRCRVPSALLRAGFSTPQGLHFVKSLLRSR
jgi:hypothetical protein